MKVKCIYNTGKALRFYEEKSLKRHEFGRFGTSELSAFDLTIGEVYLVMGMVIYEGNLNYVVNDGRIVSANPYQLFEVVESDLPASWHFRAFPKNNEILPSLEAVWGYYELCYVDGHYEQLIEMEEEAHRTYFKRKIELEKEFVG